MCADAKTLAPKIVENTDDAPDAEGSVSDGIVENTDDVSEVGWPASRGFVGDTGKAAATNDAMGFEDGATVEEILAGVPLPSDPCFGKPPSVRYIPRTHKYTKVLYELEWNRGYTRRQSMWLMGADRPGEKKMNTKLIYMRLFRHMNCFTDEEKTRKQPMWKKRAAPDSARDEAACIPGLLEELVSRYGEESLVPGSGDWEMDLVPQWARRIWRLFARACKLKNLKTPDVSNFP